MVEISLLHAVGKGLEGVTFCLLLLWGFVVVLVCVFFVVVCFVVFPPPNSFSMSDCFRIGGPLSSKTVCFFLASTILVVLSTGQGDGDKAVPFVPQ